MHVVEAPKSKENAARGNFVRKLGIIAIGASVGMISLIVLLAVMRSDSSNTVWLILFVFVAAGTLGLIAWLLVAARRLRKMR